MLTAITRQVSPRLGECNLTFLERRPVDAALAAVQHRGYEQCLRESGARVVSLDAAVEFPDSVFVEDPAIVLDEIAVMCRMGAESRRGEALSLAEAIGGFRECRWMHEPATLEGGDVVRIGRTLYVGISRRTNREGAAQLAQLIAPFGYRVVPVGVTGCLHLKSAYCYLGDETALANREWMDAGAFGDLRILDVPEPWAADVLRIGGTVVIPASFPRTRELLDRSGFRTRAIDVSELQKAEAGVTCMSLVFDSKL